MQLKVANDPCSRISVCNSIVNHSSGIKLGLYKYFHASVQEASIPFPFLSKRTLLICLPTFQSSCKVVLMILGLAKHKLVKL